MCSYKVICLIRLFYSGRATTTDDDDGVGLSERSRLWSSEAVIAAGKVHPGNYLRSEERKMQYGTYQITKFNKRCLQLPVVYIYQEFIAAGLSLFFRRATRVNIVVICKF